MHAPQHVDRVPGVVLRHPQVHDGDRVVAVDDGGDRGARQGGEVGASAAWVGDVMDRVGIALCETGLLAAVDLQE